VRAGVRKAPRRRIVALFAVCGIVGLAAAGAWVATRPDRQDVWSLPPIPLASGSPAAVADVYLAAAKNGDIAGIRAVFNLPKDMDEGEFAEPLSANLREIGGIERYLIFGMDADMGDDGSKELAIVWSVVKTGRAGDIQLDIYLERPKGTGDWRVTTVSGALVGPGGLVRPPKADPEGKPLASTGTRLRRLGEYEDAVLKAALKGGQEGGIPVIVSPKIELAFVVAGLTGSAPEFAGPNSVLGPDALGYFGKHRRHRRHEALGAMDFVNRRGLRYDAIAKFASCFSDPPGLEQVFPFGDYLCSRTYGIGRSDKEARLLDLGERLRTFYTDAGFGSYLQEHQKDYDAMVAGVKGVLPHGVPGALRAYYGTGHAAYVVVVSAFSGNYALTLEEDGWTCAVAVISGSLLRSSGNPASGLWTLLIHEWSHTLVKPALDLNAPMIASYAHLYPAIANDMMSGGQAYASWRIAVEEHIIRAAEARMVLALGGTAEAEAVLARNEKLGFRYIRLFYNRLADFEGDRRTFPTFVDFVPRLLSALDGA
jgi:hypothetical protein